MNPSPQWQAWKQRAEAISLDGVARERQLKLKRSGRELIGPCPRCDGDDRFAINIAKQVFNCRCCGAKGNVIALVQFIDGCDFVTACTTLTGEPPPRTNSKGNGRAGELERAKKVAVETYSYPNADNVLAFQTQRVQFQLPDGSFVLTKQGKPKKTFWQRRPNPQRPGDFIYDLDGVELVPYRLPELIKAVAAEQRIFIVEGERKVDLLREMGAAATGCPMGAGKWPENFCTYFAGADVAIVPDNDKPGSDHAHDVARKLHNARSIKIVELPGLTPK
jgi:DNA primase